MQVGKERENSLRMIELRIFKVGISYYFLIKSKSLKLAFF